MSEVRKYKEPRMYAKDKLEEASYFLSQMRRSYVDVKEFIFNMNAFLSSARSVTLVLQKEFEHNPDFEAWYSKKQKEMKEDKIMDFFVKNRDVSIHEEGMPRFRGSVKTMYAIPHPKDNKKQIYVRAETKVSRDAKGTASYLVSPYSSITGKTMYKPIYSIVESWEFETGPEGYQGKDILWLCGMYYGKLEQLLREVERELLKRRIERG
jgi:hypothetical protein